jgi:hypothetical protein
MYTIYVNIYPRVARAETLGINLLDYRFDW